MRRLSNQTNPYGSACTAVIGSMTNSIKAQEALMNAAIYSTVMKVTAAESENGCAYGVTFQCSQSAEVRSVLGASNIRIRKILS